MTPDRSTVAVIEEKPADETVALRKLSEIFSAMPQWQHKHTLAWLNSRYAEPFKR